MDYPNCLAQWRCFGSRGKLQLKHLSTIRVALFTAIQSFHIVIVTGILSTSPVLSGSNGRRSFCTIINFLIESQFVDIIVKGL